MDPKPPIWKTKDACSQNWNQMRGDDTRRFCDQCQKHVHNISAMTPAERVRLAETDQSPCIFYFERKDGGVAELSLLAKIRRWFPFLRFVSWTALIALLPVFLSGCMGISCKQREKLSQELVPNSDTNTPPAQGTRPTQK